MEKYITANAASNTPPSVKIKVVTICSPISISKERLVGVQRLICSSKTSAQMALNFAKLPVLLRRSHQDANSTSTMLPG
jgi:hypothetical protein